MTMIYCVGELLIDMFCLDRDTALKDGVQFQKMPGGAPANVAVTISKLGGRAAFAGSVGNDAFGDFLIETLSTHQVDTKMIARDDQFPTTIAFVSLTADGERDFQFNRGADRNLHFDEDEIAQVMESNVIHFGSATALLPGPLRETYFSLMEEAKRQQKFISFDPNFRIDLWGEDVGGFIDLSEKALGYTDFVKLSEEEFAIITGTKDLTIGVKRIHDLGAKIVAVTLGKKGTFLSIGKEQVIIPSIEITNVDSTGAGDAFVGAMLYQFELNHSAMLDLPTVQKMIRFANVVGALACTKIGSLAAIPCKEEVDLLLAKG
jgi:fructokinase